MAKQYRLLKDLPDYKAGTIFEFDGLFYLPNDVIRDNFYAKWLPNQVQNNPEWFEEIAPESNECKIYINHGVIESFAKKHNLPFDEVQNFCYWVFGSNFIEERNYTKQEVLELEEKAFWAGRKKSYVLNPIMYNWRDEISQNYAYPHFKHYKKTADEG